MRAAQFGVAPPSIDARQLLEAASRLSSDSLGQLASESDAAGEFPSESVRHLREAGLLALGVPAEFGGAAGTPGQFATMVETIARADGSLGMIYVMHFAAAKSIEGSTLADKETLLRKIADGSHLSTLAASEQGSRSLFWMPMSKLEPAASGYTVNASKSWVTSAHHADSIVATTQSPAADSPMNSVCFLAYPKNPGVTVGTSFDGLGLRSNDAAPIELRDYAVASGDLICEFGTGFQHLLGTVLPWFLVGTAAHSVGLCRSAIHLVEQHLTNSKFAHDGSRLADLPNLRGHLARMSTTTDAASALLDRAVGAMESGDATATLLLLEARLFAIEAAVEVTDRALRCGGGAAFSKRVPLERVFRDSLAGRVMAPTTDHLQDLIGKARLGMDLF